MHQILVIAGEIDIVLGPAGSDKLTRNGDIQFDRDGRGTPENIAGIDEGLKQNLMSGSLDLHRDIAEPILAAILAIPENDFINQEDGAEIHLQPGGTVSRPGMPNVGVTCGSDSIHRS